MMTAALISVQAAIRHFLHQRRDELKILVLMATRVRVSATRARVPDLCVMLGEGPGQELFTTAPLTNRMSRMHEKIRDYLGMGIRYGALIDQYAALAWIHTSGGAVEAKDGVLRTTDPLIEMPLTEVLP